MHFISFTFVLSAFTLAQLPLSFAGPVLYRQYSQNCTSPSLRQEWSSVSQDVRDNYISAVLCLSNTPSKTGLSTTLYDDFAHVHNALNYQIHFVAQFLPWHRYFVHVYEQSLKQCGYTGTALYWDWTKDSANPSAAAIWDAKTGIGGNGNRSIPDGQPRCVIDGPFKGLRPAYTVGNYDPHCLARDWNNGTYQIGDMLGSDYSPEEIAAVNQKTTYPAFHTKLENGAHGAVHSGIGGDMSPATSPNDPVFFLHHTQIDRLWWLWQNAGANRTYMFGGDQVQTSTTVPTSPPAALTDLMPMLGMAEDMPIEDVMSTETELLCYSY